MDPTPSRTLRLRYPLRRWQEAALRHWIEHDHRGIVEVVTGGGKTVFAEACIMAELERRPGTRILIVVPTISLADQWAVALQYELHVPEADIGVFVGGKRPIDKRFAIMVLNTARELGPRLAAQGSTFLIADECHRVGSDKNLAAVRAPYVATLGLSATPDRQYDQALAESIIPAIGPVIFRYDLRQARADDVVTHFDLVNIQVSMLADERDAYTKLTRRIRKLLQGRPDDAEIPDSVKTLLQRRARISALATMRIPVTARLLDEHRGQRVMIFHEDIRCADKIAAIANQRGHSATTYHTGVSPIARRSNLLLYRRGVLRVMVSCRALDEGINVPETEVAIIASGTATTRQRVQRLGRVLRPAPGKERATIYTLFATRNEQKRLEKEEADLVGSASVRWLKAAAPHG